jgi:cyclohexanone monooxygenase
VVLRQIESQIDDPALRDKVTPTHRLGCKRFIFSNDYYRTLNKPHVHVVTGEPVALRPNAVVDEEGNEHKADMIVYATGFDITGSFDRIRIEGTGGRLLEDAWRTGPHTYNGVAVPDSPTCSSSSVPMALSPTPVL